MLQRILPDNDGPILSELLQMTPEMHGHARRTAEALPILTASSCHAQPVSARSGCVGQFHRAYCFETAIRICGNRDSTRREVEMARLVAAAVLSAGAASVSDVAYAQTPV